MKAAFLIVFLFISASAFCTQVDTAKNITAPNIVYFEWFGNGVLYSLNYERFISNDISLRCGLSYFGGGIDGGQGSVLTLPFLANYMLNFGSSHMQMGAGLTFVAATSDYKGFTSDIACATALIGYRYQPPDGGFMFEISFTPLMMFDNGLFLSGGIGIGEAF
jgi:hypothetical protein